jgi:alkylhydroperoxidase family enzyme
LDISFQIALLPSHLKAADHLIKPRKRTNAFSRLLRGVTRHTLMTRKRAALALAEAVTRLSDGPDPVPDEIWNEAARHYTEPQLASLVLWVAVTNVWNRLNVATRQVAGEWAKSAEAQKWAETGSAPR